jgi:hypothetical protein
MGSATEPMRPQNRRGYQGESVHANGGDTVDFEAISRILVQLFIVAFTAWGLAGLMLSLRNKRSTLRAWWRGSTYFGPRSALHQHQFE